MRDEQSSRDVLHGTLSEFAMTQAENRPNDGVYFLHILQLLENSNATADKPTSMYTTFSSVPPETPPRREFTRFQSKNPTSPQFNAPTHTSTSATLWTLHAPLLIIVKIIEES